MLNKGTFEEKGNAKKGLTGRFFHVTILPIGDGKKTLFVKRRTRHASHHYHRAAGKKKPAKWRAKKGGISRPCGLD
jgi:hypothetical protein